MNEIPDMENKLENALNSFDGIQRATPQPYFYTRLRARMSKDREWGGIISVISRPVFAVAVVCAVLLMNTWIFFRTDTAVNAGPPVAATGDIPDEYNVAVNTFYNYDTTP
ncbi:MAG: hypothetical protein ABI480_08770 [Chitinophagaceae bacterium]